MGGLLRLGGFIAVVWLVVNVVGGMIWPRSKCRKCDGTGEFRSPTGRNWRRCPRCNGSRYRRRVGRRIYNRYTKGEKDD